MQPSPYKKAVHLLYVPTLFCNMGCKYCYLGDETETKIDADKAVETLRYAIEQFTQNGYIPFNLSFHGGEVTVLSSQTLDRLFEIAQTYYRDYNTAIELLGHKANPIHIKTNLFAFDKHYDTLKKYRVSVSGSVDLPLFLHEKYRVDKQGHSTLQKIKENLKLLACYPHHKKISCVMTREHLEHLDAFIEDIRTIHYEIGLDMSRFNIMFGFDSIKNEEKFGAKIDGTQMLSDDEQVIVYEKLKEAFAGTELEAGFREHWFAEFTPAYCCSAVNCGNKFFLVQYDGEVYSCPRGQSSDMYRYGNLYRDEIDTIIANGTRQIATNENTLSIDESCLECEYFSYCNLGCTFVRTQTNTTKSYTCALQKAIYRDNPTLYPPLSPQERDTKVRHYLYANKITQLHRLAPHTQKNFTVTEELYDPKNTIEAIISSDSILQSIYSDSLFWLEIDHKRYQMQSPIRKTKREILFLEMTNRVLLCFDPKIFGISCHDEVNNTLHLMLLRDTRVIYGDEQRNKQEHIFDWSLYANSVLESALWIDGYCHLDITPLLHLHRHLFLDDVRNNLFVTTKTMREYHYEKHRKNAFYHIQAINLPFANIEFYFLQND